ncbi:NADPH-dependent ferric siderophore reductase, contains FAD-binding and SIP domains [Plantibacter flavus]|uniref:NADPH-dependent ferric siderophore reductase n=2 Tax=Plantibacter flavus TaxID=150123 RepID=A0A3N2C3G3_9MICO|nr:NADPH-dependent ferric siderophore reductase [Plantibacter flavus]SMG19319.1 NADPH-dependent ferric siderophore reductase, contains FAD-binding and SIP domains [Plantibacter flavus]
MGGRMETIMTTTPRPRAPRPQIILEVVRSSWVTPHLVRLTLGGPGFADFQPKDATDSYVKISFAKPELGLEPPYDLAALRETLAPADLPVTRTYTVRRVDQAAGTIDIDFVVHGDEGIAGPWAAAAQPGDRVVLAGPGGAYRPDPTADWHLFAGDESAIPAIAAALEALPADAKGLAFLEIGGRDDLVDLDHPSGVQLIWVGRAARDESTAALLATAISGHPWPDGRVQVFAHGERESMKALREVFLTQRGLDRSQLSLSGYWAYGRTEDRFQAEKREPIGVVLPAS